MSPHISISPVGRATAGPVAPAAQVLITGLGEVGAMFYDPINDRVWTSDSGGWFKYVDAATRLGGAVAHNIFLSQYRQFLFDAPRSRVLSPYPLTGAPQELGPGVSSYDLATLPADWANVALPTPVGGITSSVIAMSASHVFTAATVGADNIVTKRDIDTFAEVDSTVVWSVNYTNPYIAIVGSRVLAVNNALPAYTILNADTMAVERSGTPPAGNVARYAPGVIGNYAYYGNNTPGVTRIDVTTGDVIKVAIPTAGGAPCACVVAGSTVVFPYRDSGNNDIRLRVLDASLATVSDTLIALASEFLLGGSNGPIYHCCLDGADYLWLRFSQSMLFTGVKCANR